MKIEKNVPVPKPRRKHPIIDKMDVGDSVLCDNRKKIERLRDAMRYRKIQYATRRVPEGWRVWRLS